MHACVQGGNATSLVKITVIESSFLRQKSHDLTEVTSVLPLIGHSKFTVRSIVNYVLKGRSIFLTYDSPSLIKNRFRKGR